MINTNLVTINTETKTMTAEISELPGQEFERIWPDSCDMGLTLVSTKTGKVSQWVVDDDIRTSDDLVAWKLVPTTKTLRENPGLNGWKLMVYND